MDEIDYTTIKLDNFDLIIITINEDSWNDINKLNNIYKFIKENKNADFRLMMDDGDVSRISAELNEYGALVTLQCRISELKNTNK